MNERRSLADALRRRLLRVRARGPAGEGAPLLRGDGLEFAELRGYAEGDDPRRIDWAASARSGELQTRVMLEESGLHLACVLDTGPRMRLGRTRPLLDAARELAALWLATARDRDTLSVVLGERAVELGTLRGERAARLALVHLAGEERAARDEQGSINAATLAYLDATLPRGSALLLVGECYTLEALLEDVHLARLAHRRHAMARVARDPWSEGLPLRGAVALRDATGEEWRTLWIDRAAAERHAAACARRETRILATLERAGWHARLFDESTPPADLLDI